MTVDWGNHVTAESLAGGQPTQKKTDLSAHVDGGQSAKGSGTMRAAAGSDKTVIHVACGIVLLALLLLWSSGALVFRGATL